MFANDARNPAVTLKPMAPRHFAEDAMKRFVFCSFEDKPTSISSLLGSHDEKIAASRPIAQVAIFF
jgi:hypothetical protein